jgi:hypothetical protein
MAERYDALINIVTDAAPTGVRFCYYRAVSQGIVPKTDNGYSMVQRALMHLRETGDIAWENITTRPDGCGNPTPGTASKKCLPTPKAATAERCGPTQAPASKSGANPNPSLASSGP